MKVTDPVPETIRSIANRFELDTDRLLSFPASEQLDRLRDLLTVRIQSMLITDFDSLRALLYRIDLPEEKVAELFAETGREEVAHKLSEMIIERQLHKVRSWRIYESHRDITGGNGESA